MARRSLLHRLIRGGDTTFRDYERACLDAVRARLSPEGQEVLDRQLATLHVIQRYADDKMAVMHFRSLPESDLFADTRTDNRVAKIKLLDPGKPALTATLVLDTGRLSSLEFRRSPRHLRKAAAQVSGVEMLTDPMAAVGPEPARVDRVVSISGVNLPAQQVLPPRAPEEVQRYLGTLDAPTPDDYAELLKLTDGFLLGEWEFYGTRCRTLVLDEILLVAAERLDGEVALCFRAGAPAPEVIAYDEIAGDAIATHTSFLDALLAVARPD